MPSRLDPPSPDRPPLRLGLVLFPGCMPAGLFATADLVRACALRHGRARLSTTWVAVDGAEVGTHDGPALRPQERLATARCDALLLPGLWLDSPAALERAVQAHAGLVDALRRLPARTAVWSYCAGVALAAAAGRLDGVAATATWWLGPHLADRFGWVRWRFEQALVTGRHHATAAGPAGHLPLMADRLATLYPADVLRDVAELLMLPQPRTRHPAFLPVAPMALGDERLRTLWAWAQRQPAHALSLQAAARLLHVSPRSLCRHVQAHTGLSAGAWLRRVKLDQAAEALRQGRRPVKAIAAELGFGSDAALYRAFRTATGMTPGTYRVAQGGQPVTAATRA
ncbi:helix-turn-helix domain-containing protein [Ideonella sp.]|uniref:helix-turn-helix domain-containing protein n=1 Tax=Ideonella sp. TaxID=1929293 RepID=UPI0035B44426